jgi:hypothetical protein
MIRSFPRKLSIKSERGYNKRDIDRIRSGKVVLIPKQEAPLEKRDKPDIAFGNGRRFVDLL